MKICCLAICATEIAPFLGARAYRQPIGPESEGLLGLFGDAQVEHHGLILRRLLGHHRDLADAREDLQEGRVLVEHRGADRVDRAVEEGRVDDVAWRIICRCIDVICMYMIYGIRL